MRTSRSNNRNSFQMPPKPTQRTVIKAPEALTLWNALALEIVRRLALTEKAFTTDEVWSELANVPVPEDPRALGPIMTRAYNEDTIVRSDFSVRSDRKECHARPVAVWLSKTLGGTIADGAAYVACKKRTLSAPSGLPLLDATRAEG